MADDGLFSSMVKHISQLHTTINSDPCPHIYFKCTVPPLPKLSTPGIGFLPGSFVFHTPERMSGVRGQGGKSRDQFNFGIASIPLIVHGLSPHTGHVCV